MLKFVFKYIRQSKHFVFWFLKIFTYWETKIMMLSKKGKLKYIELKIS